MISDSTSFDSNSKSNSNKSVCIAAILVLSSFESRLNIKEEIKIIFFKLCFTNAKLPD